jgi:hypothetical protein
MPKCSLSAGGAAVARCLDRSGAVAPRPEDQWRRKQLLLAWVRQSGYDATGVERIRYGLSDSAGWPSETDWRPSRGSQSGEASARKATANPRAAASVSASAPSPKYPPELQNVCAPRGRSSRPQRWRFAGKKAAEGTRTLDLLHGKSALGLIDHDRIAICPVLWAFHDLTEWLEGRLATSEASPKLPSGGTNSAV